MVNSKKNTAAIVLITVFSITFFSCKKGSRLKKPAETTIEKPTALLVFQPYRHDYRTFSFRSKIDYNDGKMDLSFNGNFRIKQDSIIWISFTGPLGIEVARAIVTLDSVRVWNKLQGERNTYPISYLQRFFPSADFYVLQDFLLGNPLLISNAPVTEFALMDIVNFTQDDVKINLRQQGNTEKHTVVSYLLKDKILNQSLDATFGNPKPIENHFFNCERNINIQRGSQTIQINLDIYKYQANETLSFPF